MSNQFREAFLTWDLLILSQTLVTKDIRFSEFHSYQQKTDLGLDRVKALTAKQVFKTCSAGSQEWGNKEELFAILRPVFLCVGACPWFDVLAVELSMYGMSECIVSIVVR